MMYDVSGAGDEVEALAGGYSINAVENRSTQPLRSWRGRMLPVDLRLVWVIVLAREVAMEALFEQHAGDPVVLVVLLVLAPFVLEEAAIVGGAAVAGAGELPASIALLSLFVGVVVSDWVLYAVGTGVGRSAWLRRQVKPETLESGQKLLRRGLWPAGLLARLIPWLLLPVFVASGYLGVGFGRFAFVNALIALAYVNVFFWGAYGINLAIFDLLAGWGWAVAGTLVVAVVLGARAVRRRFAPRDFDQG